MKKHDLIEQLHSAFPAERIAGEAAFAERGGGYPDAVTYARAIDGNTWLEVDAAYIVRRHDSLGFLSTRELVQLLPVYLRSVVEDGVMSPALDAVIVKLTRPTSALMAALGRAQREAIAGVLRWIVDQDPDGSPGSAARAALAVGYER